MKFVSVSQNELTAHGYAEITHQNENGEVIIKDESGHLEVFQIRFAPQPGIFLRTEDGRYLEFVRAVVHDEGLTTHHWGD